MSFSLNKYGFCNLTNVIKSLNVTPPVTFIIFHSLSHLTFHLPSHFLQVPPLPSASDPFILDFVHKFLHIPAPLLNVKSRRVEGVRYGGLTNCCLKDRSY